MPNSDSSRLTEYRAKRSPERTPEPFGSGDSRPRLFVVQKHAARRLHWDFRLELGGTLRSWAVPKGPSLDPADKRLAVEVEDHPVEYADFEGVIPPGVYGSGAVIVWDRGLWIALEDPEEGMRKGKLLFDLRGHKLRGVFTLVRTKRQSRDARDHKNEWLLIKKPDGYARAGTAASLPQESVLSGLTVEQRAKPDPGDEIAAELERLGAPRRRVDPTTVAPMLAESRDLPFSREGWLFELKYDGFRLLGARSGGEARLFYRRGLDATAIFPEVALAVGKLPWEHVILDGEVVVHDEQGRPSFHRLQQRTQLTRPQDIARATVDLSATLWCFDLLAFGDHDVRPLPLLERKRLLRRVVPRVGVLRFVDHIENEGERLWERIVELGLEGIVGKKADSAYRSGRSGDWQKVRVERTGDFAIVGYSDPQGARTGLGALHLAVWEPADGATPLLYCGAVGTGFSEAALDHLRRELEPGTVATPPCRGPVPTGRRHHWVKPHLACEVRYKEFTDDGLVRQAVFLRLREDKRIEECVREGGPAPPPVPAPEPAAPAKELRLSNLDKPFWPAEEGRRAFTKGDLIEYYRAIAPWMLPYLRDRPLVLTRFPDGIHGKSFYQQDAPAFLPGWIRTERMWSEDSQRDKDYIVCDDVETLVYLANLGTIPIHVWSSRVGSLGTPDWCILDLDPKGAPFVHVVKVAQAIRRLCDEIGLDCFIKTSGQAGLHLLVPLGRTCTHEQSRALAQLIARVIEQELPGIATTARVIADRGGRVYLDYLQNGHGKTIVAPFAARPKPGGPVSMPLKWTEVTARLDPSRFTLATAPARMARLGVDPMTAVLDRIPDLTAALDRLGARLGAPA